MEIELSRYCGQVVGKLAQTVRLKALRIFVFMIIYVLFLLFLTRGESHTVAQVGLFLVLGLQTPTRKAAHVRSSSANLKDLVFDLRNTNSVEYWQEEWLLGELEGGDHCAHESR